MTHNEAADAIMEVMQEFVDSERLKIWDLHKAWREKAGRFIQHYINREKNTDSAGLNQIYIKGPFAGGSIRGVLQHAKELLKPENDKEVVVPDSRSDIQIVFPFGHKNDCSYGTSDGKVIPCSCGLHDALDKLKESNDD